MCFKVLNPFTANLVLHEDGYKFFYCDGEFFRVHATFLIHVIQWINHCFSIWSNALVPQEPIPVHCTLIFGGLNTFVLQGNLRQYNGKLCIICKVVVYLELECLIILLCLLEELFQGAWWHVLSDEYHLVEKPKTETSSKQHKIFYLASCSQLCFRSFVQLRHFESS